MTLRLEQVAVRYGGRTAVQPLSLALEPGGLIGLVGPNGAGKSSLLKAVAGVLPAGGRIVWRGVSVVRMKPLERARTVSYLPQAPAAHWPMSAADVVALGRLPYRGYGERQDDADAAIVTWALEECDAAGFAERRVDELSGGERARVLLARALAVKAPVLLVDEPIQSLDPYHQLDIMSVLRAYAGRGATVVAVLHDLALAARFCTRTVLLHEGRLVGDGEPQAVLGADALQRYYRVHPYIASHERSPVILPWRKVGPD